MVSNDEKGGNKDKNYDEISDLLRRYYKLPKESDSEEFIKSVSKKIDSLFHKEVMTDKCIDETGKKLSDEERYWFGLEQYINNEVSSLKHKTITDHLLKCKECMHNYTEQLDKKKLVNESEDRMSLIAV